MTPEYAAFLERKALVPMATGLADVPPLAPHLFKFQRETAAFGLRQGRFGCFLDTGLGKTAVELEWCKQAAETSLILTPLAVAKQIESEGQKWGYDARVVRSDDDVRPGINVCNYDRLHLLDVARFGAVALDEASILKNFTGKVSTELIQRFAAHRFRMVATATPAPNDHTELAQHAAFLGVLSRDEMLVRWFINDSGDTKSWRLKGHAVEPFFDWMASWARTAEHPRDLGDDVQGYDLPDLRVHRHHALEPDGPVNKGGLFGGEISATTLHDVKRATITARAAVVAALIAAEPLEPWVIWCDTDYEGDALLAAIPQSIDVRGSQSVNLKEQRLADFAAGRALRLITKPSVAGFGLNWQHCARMIFAGRSFSYETWYQAVRRCWRFGQARPVDVHLVVAEGEDTIGRVIDRKADAHAELRERMKAAMRRAIGRDHQRRIAYHPTYRGRFPHWMEVPCAVSR